MKDLNEAQKKNLLAVAECESAEGRRLYAGQYETHGRALTALAKMGLVDSETANDKRKTYGLTDKGRSALAELDG